MRGRRGLQRLRRGCGCGDRPNWKIQRLKYAVDDDVPRKRRLSAPADVGVGPPKQTQQQQEQHQHALPSPVPPEEAGPQQRAVALFCWPFLEVAPGKDRQRVERGRNGVLW